MNAFEKLSSVGWIDQKQCVGDYGWTDEQRRLTMVQIAEAMVGIPILDPRYLVAVYPWDTKYNAESMSRTQYKCALTGLAELRAFGYKIPADPTPYIESIRGKIPDAVTQIRKLPEFETKSVLPSFGEGCLIGSNEHDTHYLLCTKVEGNTITSIDGGKGIVKQVTRKIIVNGKKIYLLDKDSGLRAIIGVLHVGRMFPEQNWMLPG